MAALTRTLVNRYIEIAEPLARTEEERTAIAMASRLNSAPARKPARRVKFKRSHSAPKRKRKFIPEMHFAADKAGEAVLGWRRIILAEIYFALCEKTRYKKQVAAIEKSAEVVILAIAASVANEVKANLVVVITLVASLLRLALSMSRSVFCRGFKGGLIK